MKSEFDNVEEKVSKDIVTSWEVQEFNQGTLERKPFEFLLGFIRTFCLIGGKSTILLF